MYSLERNFFVNCKTFEGNIYLSGVLNSDQLAIKHPSSGICEFFNSKIVEPLMRYNIYCLSILNS